MDEAPMLLTAAGKPDVTARFILVAVAERADKNGMNAHPSVADLRYRTGADRSTVQRALRRLESAKLLERDGRVGGRTRWRVAMDTRRPRSDWTEIETQEDAERAATAERVRRSRATRVTGATPVTEAGVTGAESVTDPDVTGPTPVTSLRVLGPAPVTGASVTGPEPVTGSDVTGVAPVRNALNARTEPDVTGVTRPEPSNYLTTREPSSSETPPSSESPRVGGQTTIDGEEPPAGPAKRPRAAKPKIERTPEQQERFDAAHKIAKWWWDVRCPSLKISVKETARFPGFRKCLLDYLNAKPPCTPQEIQQALEACRQSWPSDTTFGKAISAIRDATDLPVTGTDGKPTGGALQPINKVDWSKGFKVGGKRR
jgi:DNA-binding transcriptional ArsR family regulator